MLDSFAAVGFPLWNFQCYCPFASKQLQIPTGKYDWRPCADATNKFIRLISLINSYLAFSFLSFFYDNVFAIRCMSKKTKWRTELPEGFACPISPSMGPIFAGRGRVISSRRANKAFGSRFGTNTKLLRGVFGPISMPNDYLNTVFDDVVSLCGSCRNNALPRSPILSLRVKSLSIQERNHWGICYL